MTTLRQAIQHRPGFLRRGLIASAINLTIAAMLTGIKGLDPLLSVVYSMCIGQMCWLSVELVLLVLHAGIRMGWLTPSRLDPDGWPGWSRVLPGLLLTIPVACITGNALADLITGHTVHSVGDYGWRSYLGFVLMSLLVALGSTYYFYSRIRFSSAQAEIEAARRVGAETRLRLLEAQLEPHMLFNTLANLRALIAVDPDAAQDMLDHLIDFYRATLQASRRPWHPLAAEFERTRDYLALMSVRMGARLHTALTLPAELKDIEVPPLLLQPLVENAIKHGLEPQPGGGQLTVTARRQGDHLLIEVADNGAGLPTRTTSGPGTGFGLQQVRDRLHTMYGLSASLELKPLPAGGVMALIQLPTIHPPEHPVA